MPTPPSSQLNAQRSSPKPQYTSKRTAQRGSRTCVLHLCPSLDAGDPARETVDLAVQTQRVGWRALIASHGGRLVMEAERAAVRHTRMPLDRNGMLTNWRNRVQLEALVQSERPSLIHAHGIETLQAAFSLSRSHRMPLVLDLTQPWSEDPKFHKLMAQLPQADCHLRVPSEFMGHYLVDKHKISPERIHLIPPGIDLNVYNASGVSPERLHKLSSLWRLPEQAGVILVPLPLTPGMGHAVFLQALKILKNENLFAVLVGDDHHAPGLRAEIETMIDQLGLTGKVVMPESCSDWAAACWLSSVVASPNSAPRGQNVELLAAQAIGRPVIVTNSGANNEMVLSGETAWVIAPEDPKAMADALLEAVRLTTDQRLNLADGTRHFIESHFPQINWRSSMLELYDSLLLPDQRKAKVA